MRRRAVLRAGIAGIAGIAGCLGGGSDRVEIAMTDDLRFEPASVRVPAGDTIEWRNAGTVRHTVTADADQLPADAAYFASGGFTSETVARDDLTGGLIGADGTFTHTPTAPGEYGYVCLPHEGSGMTGTFTVRA